MAVPADRSVEAGDAKQGRLHELRPAPELTPFVTRLVAYDEPDMPPTRRRELPDGLATLLVNLGDPLRIEHPVAVPSHFGAGAGFFSGASSTYAVSQMERAQRGVQVMLTPLGARRLLAIPLAEVGDRLIDPVELFGTRMRETLERLQAAPTPAARMDLLQHAVASRIVAEAARPPADVVWALARLRATEGRIRIDHMAATIGCSRKHLTVRFAREFGMPPKAMGRVLRFAGALRRLRAGAAVSWAALAAACGYADQSHLGRDFAALSGDWPRALAARALPDDAGFRD